MALNLIHLNGNILCATHAHMSGPTPYFHEIVQLCLLPLDSNLEVRRDLPPFDVYIRPSDESKIDYDCVDKKVLGPALENGLPSEKAFDLFEHWFTRLTHRENKKIIPLVFNWNQYEPFIRDWAGHYNFNHYFHSYARDLQTIACFLNDLADLQAISIPYPDVLTITMLASRLNVEVEPGFHDSVYLTLLVSRVYKALLKSLVIL